MLKLAFSIALLCSAATAALAASPAEILAANKAASGGAAWDAKATLKTEYAYSGQGMGAYKDYHQVRFASDGSQQYISSIFPPPRWQYVLT